MTSPAASSTEPYGKKNPFPAPALRKTELTEKNSPKEAIQIDFSLEGSGLTYEAGDALGVFPTNDPALVDELIAALGLCPGAETPLPDGGSSTLREALIHSYDITSISKSLLAKWEGWARSPGLSELMESGDKDRVSAYCVGRGLIDLALEYPVSFENAEQLVGLLKKLSPRLYSIASSPKAHPGEVQLTVGVVRYTSYGRQRHGVCSTFMSDRVGNGTAGVFVHSNKNFRLPEDATKPVIMVGPGTGIAPFRAFIEERLATGATGLNWLFFGNPHRASDFLYEDWLLGLEKEGRLKLSLAFSRDQEEKLYVQHLIESQSAEFWALMQQGAYFYICGDASRMAKDVEHALKVVAEKEGSMTAEEADAYIKELKKDKRYQRDVY